MENGFERDLPYCKKMIIEAIAVVQVGKSEIWIQGSERDRGKK
jgi:hypothetical protein